MADAQAERERETATRRRSIRHVINAAIVSAIGAAGISNLLLGELLGAGATARVVAWCASFAAFMAFDLTSAGAGEPWSRRFRLRRTGRPRG
jgi:hypothetical protein